MPEILTESFCERCGTRYTFEPAAPKGKRLGKLKVFSKGFVNFVSNDESSLDEALADARSDEQRELTGRQLDAFHQTFQFCLSCRQYTCANCWNETESRCLSCAPHLGQDVLGAPFPALDPMTDIGFALRADRSAGTLDDNGNGASAAAAWPTTDVAPLASPEPTADATPDLPELTAGAEAPAAIDVEPVDDDVARAVAEAELARQAHDRAEAEAERARKAEVAAEAERARQVEVAAEAERARQAEVAAEAERVRDAELAAEAERARQAQAAADADAERLRQAQAEAEAEHARRAQAEEDAERLRQIAARADAEEALLAQELKEAERFRHAAAADEVERVRLSAQVEAELASQAQAEVEAERRRQAKADAEWAQAVAEADRLQRIAAEAEADRARQARAEAEAESERARQAQAAASAEADRARQAQARADAEAERARQAAAETEAERARQAAADADRAREAAARAASAAQRPDDRVGSPIWQIVAPEPSTTPQSSPLDVPPAILAPQPPLPVRPAASGTATPPAAGGPAWPAPAPAPQWPMPPAGGAPEWPAQQSIGAASGTAGLWAASSEDVISKPGPTGVQACLSCGLPLSASARFCRRCGTQQH